MFTNSNIGGRVGVLMVTGTAKGYKQLHLLSKGQVGTK